MAKQRVRICKSGEQYLATLGQYTGLANSELESVRRLRAELLSAFKRGDATATELATVTVAWRSFRPKNNNDRFLPDHVRERATDDRIERHYET